MEFNHEPRAGVEEYLPIIEQFPKQKHAPSLAVAFTMFFLLSPHFFFLFLLAILLQLKIIYGGGRFSARPQKRAQDKALRSSRKSWSKKDTKLIPIGPHIYHFT